MKKSLLGLLAMATFSLSAQVRYLDPVFNASDIVKMPDQIYGINWFAYAPASIGGPQLLPLQADIYMPSPAVDTAQSRPVVVYLHTGSFLPKGLAGPMGERQDSAAVEFCTRFARMGYVAISATYRVGWLANSTDLDLRRGTNLLAVYNAIQDAKALVRFLNVTVDTAGNPLKINKNAISLMGQGSGGYITFGYATLDKYSELTFDKFKYDEPSATGLYGFPVAAGDLYVDTSVVGDWNGYGGAVTLTGQTTPLGLPQVNTSQKGRNFINHPGFSDDIAMVVNLGGALGDSTWLEQGDVPMVSTHVFQDFFAPYFQGMVNVPIGAQFFPVVEVAGSYNAVRRANNFGNNNVLGTDWFDPISVNARSNSTTNPGAIHHILPFDIPPPNAQMPFRVNSNPWDWWDANDPAGANETNPNIKSQSMAYIDSIMGFVAPRMAKVLNSKGYSIPVSVEEFRKNNKAFSVFPNPSSDVITIQTSERARSIELFDLSGRMIQSVMPTASESRMDVQSLPKGMYIIKVDMNGEIMTRKLVVR